MSSRFLEYTDQETESRYRELTPKAVVELKQYPIVFMMEGDDAEAFIAQITNVEILADRRGTLRIHHEPFGGMERIPGGSFQRLGLELDIKPFEFHRSHWAIKDCDLFEVFRANTTVRSDDIDRALANLTGNDLPELEPPKEGALFNEKQIFIVHGHDEHTKNDVKEYISELGLDPIILQSRASSGRTIIENIEHYSVVGYAIVLYTECDIGAKRDTTSFKWRARQNVVFEHGYMNAKLGRNRVAALVKGDVEIPNDIRGLVYIIFDSDEEWKSALATELTSAGYSL
jgi:predicted nucleotide-binding protein